MVHAIAAIARSIAIPARTARWPTARSGTFGLGTGTIIQTYDTSGPTQVDGREDTGTRARLLAATQGCLRDRGLGGRHLAPICDSAGANLAAITYYFGSKEQLVGAALAEELRGWLQPVLDLLAGDRDPAARLVDAVTRLNETFEQQQDRAPGLLEVFVHAARDPDGHNPFAPIWTELRTRLAVVIAALRDADAVPGWVAPDAMAAVILAVGAGTVVSAAVGPDRVDHRGIATQFASLLLAAGTPSAGTASGGHSGSE